MHISHFELRNFRALHECSIDLNPHINVIVGPNGVGKTTILQAIRLVKALLAPRSQQEAQQALQSLGASSPHVPQRLLLNALMRDVALDCSVRLTFVMSDQEIVSIQALKNDIARNSALGALGQSLNAATALQFMASPAGLQAQMTALTGLEEGIAELVRTKALTIGFRIDALSKQIETFNAVGGMMIQQLDIICPPSLSIFSYFPADRALPFGEVAVQLGSNDISQQIESHNSQPQLKYLRLKNLIFSSIVMGTSSRESITAEFDKIFVRLLKGRKIENLGINELGLLSVITKNDEGRLVEIDNLSSGEKNLILTFLLIANTVARGGIVLFDEPELHLNPAICRDMIDFLIKDYSVASERQFILCTHSAEMLAEAFSNDKAALFHVRSQHEVSLIGPSASDEYEEALAGLGVPITETLLYQGTILVEGEDDAHYLRTGFPELLKKFLIKVRGGRQEVQKAALEIRKLEEESKDVRPITIIIDLDDKEFDLPSSDNLKVLQWPRRCIENFLIDLEVIVPLLKRADVARSPMKSHGEISKALKAIAFKQLEAFAARIVMRDRKYLSPSPKNDDFNGTLSEVATNLFIRLHNSHISTEINLCESEWLQEFSDDVASERSRLELEWESSWIEKCDGKRLFDDIQKEGLINWSKTSFKRTIIQNMKEQRSSNWKLMESLLQSHLPEKLTN